jgi:glycosyltransferase involved in cell wall biosynthesis
MSQLYRRVPFGARTVTRDRTLLLSRQLSRPVEVPAGLVSLLSRCTGVRTLAEFAEGTARPDLFVTSDVVAPALEMMVGLGLLQPYSPCVATEMEAATEISTIGIVTRDRPASLRRCLDSVVRHAEEYAFTSRVIVVDGSESEAVSAQNRSLLSEVARTSNLVATYVGQDEARRIREVFAEDARVAAFLLTPGEAAAARNLILLMTSGENILLLDDDVICRTWLPEQGDQGIELLGHGEPRQISHFPSRQLATAIAGDNGPNLLASHASVLGRRVHSLLSVKSPVSLVGGCDQQIAAVEAGIARVRVSFAGLAGDSGSDGARGCVVGDRRNAFASLAEYELAMTSREVRAIAPHIVISHNRWCMAYCMGLVNVGTVPFFPPVGRNQDGVWGAFVQACDGSAAYAHLPLGIVHDSDRPSRFSLAQPSIPPTRLADVLLAMLNKWPLGEVAHLAPDSSLSDLGDFFRLMARAPSADFGEILSRTIVDFRCGEARTDEDRNGVPREARERYREQLMERMLDPDFSVPFEHSAASALGSNGQSRFDTVRLFVGMIGESLCRWTGLQKRSAEVDWASILA